VSVTAIVLSYHREPNIGQILSALRQQTFSLEEVILINNNPKHQFKDRDCTVLNSNKNWGCPIRHAIGLLAKTSHCLFIDDDVLLENRAVENLVGWAARYPESIIGWQGRRIRKGKCPYSKSPPLAAKGVQRPVDVVMGKLHLCRRDKLLLPFAMMDRLARLDHFSCDDIALSLANKISGGSNYVVPMPEGAGAKELDQFGIGLGHAQDWWEKRDHAVRVMLGVGGEETEG